MSFRQHSVNTQYIFVSKFPQSLHSHISPLVILNVSVLFCNSFTVERDPCQTNMDKCTLGGDITKAR